MRKWFYKTKRITPGERELKTAPKNDVGSCVHFCLRSLGCMERCVLQKTEGKSLTFPPMSEGGLAL